MLAIFFAVVAAFAIALTFSKFIAVPVGLGGLSWWFWRIRQIERTRTVFTCTTCGTELTFNQLWGKGSDI
jgi:hypothetical protein